MKKQPRGRGVCVVGAGWGERELVLKGGGRAWGGGGGACVGTVACGVVQSARIFQKVPP
jgi:hypothetical protein